MRIDLFFLILSYAVDILVLLGAGMYGFYCILSDTVINGHLAGRRAKVAVLLAFLWLCHVYASAYSVYDYGQSVGWDLTSEYTWSLVEYEAIGAIGTILTVGVVAGSKFGEK